MADDEAIADEVLRKFYFDKPSFSTVDVKETILEAIRLTRKDDAHLKEIEDLELRDKVRSYE